MSNFNLLKRKKNEVVCSFFFFKAATNNYNVKCTFTMSIKIYLLYLFSIHVSNKKP